MGNALNTETLVLWRFLVKDGSWWTVKQLTHHWRPTFSDFEIEAHLEALVKGGFLESRRHPINHLFCGHQYGFTSSCSVLPGEELESVQP